MVLSGIDLSLCENGARCNKYCCFLPSSFPAEIEARTPESDEAEITHARDHARHHSDEVEVAPAYDSLAEMSHV